MSAGDIRGGGNAGRELGQRPVHAASDQDVLHQGSAGQSVVVQTDVAGVPGPFREIFSVQGSARRGQALSLLFLPPMRGDGAALAATDDVDVEARVTFGTHGCSSEVFLDVLNGGRVSVPCSFLRVEVRVTGGVGVVAGTAIRVAAVAGYQAAGSSQGQRSVQRTVAEAPATADFPIPPYSKAVTVLVTPITIGGGYSLSWLDAGGAVVGTMDFPVGAAAFGTGPGPEQPNTSSQNGPRAGFPIPSRARTLRFTNGGVIRNFVQAIFEVQL